MWLGRVFNCRVRVFNWSSREFNWSSGRVVDYSILIPHTTLPWTTWSRRPMTTHRTFLNPVSGCPGGLKAISLVIGPHGGTEICDWLHLLDQISPNLVKSEMKRLSPLIGR